MDMDNNEIEEIGGMKVFSNPEDLAASMNAPQEAVVEQPQNEQPEQPQVEAQEVQQEVQQEIQQESQTEVEAQVESQEPMVQDETPQVEAPVVEEESYSDQEIESAVFEYLSEKLGRNLQSIDDLSQPEPQPMDNRIEAISRFVEETGRSPQDWFAYQSLNPSEMDDMTAVRVSMASEYPNLSSSELNLLVTSKYKLDPDVHSDEEVQLSQIQLKVDAQKAKGQIEGVRSAYLAPEQVKEQAPQAESIITSEWINEMSREVDALEGLEFSLGNDKTFTFGLTDQYKGLLKQKNARLDEYFAPYVGEDGRWDYDSLSSHRALVDNIDAIVSSVYKQGLGDGQKGLVSKAANVQAQTPSHNDQGGNKNSALADKVKELMRGQGNGLSINPMNFK